MGGSNLEDTSLDGANLERAVLQGANLWAASLAGAILGGANLSFANLQGATLRDADLDGVMLWGATLENANVGFASLQAADLGSVNAAGANFRGESSWRELPARDTPGCEPSGRRAPKRGPLGGRPAWREPRRRQLWRTDTVAGRVHSRAVRLRWARDRVPEPSLVGDGLLRLTMRQASRDSWRIGQPEAVPVVFMAYRNTLQANALKLAGRSNDGGRTLRLRRLADVGAR